MPNDQLFIDVLAQIEREPKSWNQLNWANPCGTNFCFAGHAVRLAGHEIIYATSAAKEIALARDRDTGRPTHISDLAVGELQITSIQASQLFFPYNDLDTLYRDSAEILNLDEAVLRDKVKDANHA